MRILVIDDNPYDAELVRVELKRHGQFDFDHAESYAEFKEYYSTRKYSAILSDYHLPGTSTIDILKEVRSGDKIIPYIFVSGTVGEEQAVELIRLGATDYVLKNNLSKLPLALKRAIKEMETIQAEKEAIKSLIKSEAKFRNLMEASPDALVVANKEGEIIYANQQVSALFGYSNNELLYKKVEMLMPERFRERHKGHRGNYIANRSSREMGTANMYPLYGRRKDGSEFAIEISLKNIESEEGLMILSIIRDITEQIKKEEKIRFDAKLLNSVDQAVIATDLTGAITYWNVAAEKIYGWTTEEAIGKNIVEITPTDLSHSEAVEIMKLLVQGKSWSGEFMVKRKDGSSFPALVSDAPILDLDGNITGIMGVSSDITELKRAEKEKTELQERAMEMLEEKVIERTEELYRMNHVLELRNHEITDSINYAQNIQRAILAKSEDCRNIFPDCFVFWMPKAIVSGDFYWCYSNEKYGFLAVVDCTGHGVPGALMSIIANQLLDRVVNTYGFIEPNKILYHLNHAIVSSLKQDTGKVRDGMDIAICRVDKKKKELVFAGAQRPLFYFDGENLNEIHGSKEGIGGLLSGDERKKFSETTISYKTGDSFYLTSDGYYSQFGGDKGKKMMKRRMKEHLSTIVHKPTEYQKQSLYEFYKQWQGAEEQVDDVLVIGVRF